MDIKKFKKIKWENTEVGQEVWIAGNLNTLGKPTVCYGPHIVLDPDNFQLKSKVNGLSFYERWPCLYVPKKLNYYDRELQLIIPKKGKKSNVKIKLLGNESIVTKWMNLNLDSIESFQAFIDIMKDILEEEET